MTIAIVTDSTSDLPPEVIAQYHIEVIPAMLVIDGQTYIDGQGLSREDFYKQLPGYKIPPTTSAPSIGLFHQIYDRLILQGACQILSFHPPASLSGLVNIANIAAQSFIDRIKVIDTGQVTLGLGFQVMAAAEAAVGGAGINEIIEAAARIGQKVRFIALLDTLEYIRRSGRVGWATAAVSNFLNLKVMIEVRKGRVFRLGLFRTRQQGLAQLLNHLKNLGPLEKLALVYTDLAHSEELAHIIEASKGQVKSPPFVLPVTTVIGTHVGPDGIGFIAVPA